MEMAHSSVGVLRADERRVRPSLEVAIREQGVPSPGGPEHAATHCSDLQALARKQLISEAKVRHECGLRLSTIC